MRHYDELATYDRGGFLVVVDKTWEDISPRDLFEAEDAPEIMRRIDDGTYEWFMMRVRVLCDGHELASEYLGGMCYENAHDCLTDGTAEDIIDVAMVEARREAQRLHAKLAEFVV